MTVSGAITSDVTSAEYSSRISVLSEHLRSLRASYAVALQDREDAETQESLYSKRLDAEIAKFTTIKHEVRAIEKSKLELNRTLNQLEAVMQERSCSMLEHENLKEDLVELTERHTKSEQQHAQQATPHRAL